MYNLSSGAIFNDIEWPFTQILRSHHLMLNISEMVRVTLIGTYACPTQGCHFEWLWVTWLKYSMIQSIAWSVCNSSATCLNYDLFIKCENWECYDIVAVCMLLL